MLSIRAPGGLQIKDELDVNRNVHNGREFQEEPVKRQQFVLKKNNKTQMHFHCMHAGIGFTHDLSE